MRQGATLIDVGGHRFGTVRASGIGRCARGCGLTLVWSVNAPGGLYRSVHSAAGAGWTSTCVTLVFFGSASFLGSGSSRMPTT